MQRFTLTRAATAALVVLVGIISIHRNAEASGERRLGLRDDSVAAAAVSPVVVTGSTGRKNGDYIVVPQSGVGKRGSPTVILPNTEKRRGGSPTVIDTSPRANRSPMANAAKPFGLIMDTISRLPIVNYGRHLAEVEAGGSSRRRLVVDFAEEAAVNIIAGSAADVNGTDGGAAETFVLNESPLETSVPLKETAGPAPLDGRLVELKPGQIQTSSSSQPIQASSLTATESVAVTDGSDFTTPPPADGQHIVEAEEDVLLVVDEVAAMSDADSSDDDSSSSYGDWSSEDESY